MSDSSDDLEAFFHLMSDVKPLTQDRIEERETIRAKRLSSQTGSRSSTV